MFLQELACKTLLSLKMFAQLASTNWLFNEGFYLHSRLTANVFNTSDAPFKFFHAVGWGKLSTFIHKCRRDSSKELSFSINTEIVYQFHSLNHYLSLGYGLSSNILFNIAKKT